MSGWNETIQSDAFKALSREPMTETGVEGAVERVGRFLSEWATSPKRDPHYIYGLNIGDEREAVLTTADLRALLARIATLEKDREKDGEALKRIAHPEYGLGFNRLRGIARARLEARQSREGAE